MEHAVYWPDSANNVNDVLKTAVRIQTRCGSNRTGAIATVAAWLGVSPQIVKMRINDEIVGEPRSKGLLAARCWEFLAMVAQRERAWVENLALEVEQNRQRLQLAVPPKGQTYAHGDQGLTADQVDHCESALASAHRALDRVDEAKRRHDARA